MAPHKSVLIAILAAFLLLAPATQAAYAFGSIVDKNDYDFHQAPSVRGTVPSASKFVLPCFIDEDGDGRLDPAEPLYLAVRLGLSAGCDQVRQKDVRLSSFDVLPAGTEVKAGYTDPDAGLTLTQLGDADAPAHAIRVYNDGDIGVTTVRKSDTVYLDVANVGATPPRVDVGDLRLTPFGALKAGTRVQDGDADQNMPLDEFNGGATKTLYTANMIFEFGKSWYLNADVDAGAGGAVEEGDVRLTAAVPNPFTDIAAGITSTVTASLGAPGTVVTGLTLSQATVRPGQAFQVLVTVKNPTAKVGSSLVNITLDDRLVDARGTPTLAQNEVQTLVATLVAPLDVGRHKVAAGEQSFFLKVEGTPVAAIAAASTVAPAVANVGANNAPGLAPIALLGAFVLVLMALRRRAL